MGDFSLYFQLGLEHILDWEGYDHILFVAVLCGIYLLRDWRQVVVLVTAFTVGHSITLALSVLAWVRVPTELIEFLIPVTILITAASNIANRTFSTTAMRFTYLLALLFGLIHGLGFSNYLKSLLGRSTNVAAELLAFNVGLEVGQIVIVLLVLFLSYVVVQVGRAPRREWNLFLSSAVFGIALVMAVERGVELWG
jgi:hypothetical protein